MKCFSIEEWTGDCLMNYKLDFSFLNKFPIASLFPYANSRETTKVPVHKTDKYYYITHKIQESNNER